jgi:hypothetical protein
MAIHLFWDNSNIWLVGRNVCAQREPGDENSFRIHFAHLFDFVVNSRAVDFAFVAGSIPPASDPLWQRFGNLGIQVVRQERGQQSGGEIAVDEAIQLQMANRVLEVASPETMVLLTGDGNGYTQGRGFLRQLELVHRHGWQIEVVSWNAGCNGNLRTFAQANGTYRPLEPVYENVTFINNKRWAAPV